MKKERLNCKYCEKSYTLINNLTRHTKVKHSIRMRGYTKPVPGKDPKLNRKEI